MENSTIRIDKFLSGNGYCSRRKVENFLMEHTVTVNGKKIKSHGARLDKSKDTIIIDGKEIEKPNFVYILLNKPRGVVSTVSDEKKRPTVITLVKEKERVYPVGRLDQDSRGLILLTNDGELTYRLTHPKFHIPKIYLVTVGGSVPKDKLGRLRKGIRLVEGMTAQADVEIIRSDDKVTVMKFIIHEGWKRQIRRMCEIVRLRVLDLQRIGIGPIELGDLEEGKYRKLEMKELESLKSITSDVLS